VIHLSLSGNAYDVGWQHGESLRSMIYCALQERPWFFDRSARPNEQALGRRTRSLATEFPELVSEIKGIADGVGRIFEDLLLYNLEPLPGACSNIAFLCNEGPLLGHVNDVRDGRFDVAFHFRFDDGQELLHIGVAGKVGTNAAVNSNGLAVSHACARSAGLGNPSAFFDLPLLRRALIGRCRDCQEAKSFLSEYSFASGADNIIAVDSNGCAFVAERLPSAMEFRVPDKGAIYCTGRPLHPHIRRLIGQEAYEQRAPEMQQLVSRERYFEAIIEENADRLSLNLVKRILRCTEQGVAVWNEISQWAAILLPREFQALVVSRTPSEQEFALLRD